MLAVSLTDKASLPNRVPFHVQLSFIPKAPSSVSGLRLLSVTAFHPLLPRPPRIPLLCVAYMKGTR